MARKQSTTSAGAMSGKRPRSTQKKAASKPTRKTVQKAAKRAVKGTAKGAAKRGPAAPSISEAEWKVMKVLWSRSPLPAYDVIQELRKTENWHPNTIKTMLSRLHQKGVLGIERYKNLYRYEPIVSEEKCIQGESESFLQRVFGGSVSDLVAHFLSRKKLSKAEAREVKRHLRE